uniref:Uncharacterized protein n=1 Tax=Parascaris univalens TaxID=6257 RepID=A0A915AGD2_PARUN
MATDEPRKGDHKTVVIPRSPSFNMCVWVGGMQATKAKQMKKEVVRRYRAPIDPASMLQAQQILYIFSAAFKIKRVRKRSMLWVVFVHEVLLHT